MIRKAAMAARKMPAEARMLAVVAAASAGTMSVCRTPNWANGASIAMASRPSAGRESEPALGLVGRLAIRAVIDRLVIWSLTNMSSDRLGWPSARVSWRP